MLRDISFISWYDAAMESPVFEPQRIASFQPIVPPDARVLILGSIPGRDSLLFGEYYGHRRNHFWPMIYRISAMEGNPWSESYEQRLKVLEYRGAALWDVFASCLRIRGSLDQSIREGCFNSIDDLLDGNPQIRAVFFNGAAAERGFLRYAGQGLRAGEGKLPKYRRLTLLRLPSSSPIPTKTCRNLEEKIVYWEELNRFLR